MIAVIADDITGGAEIAGIGLRYGLRVELSTRSDIPCPDADLWVVSTDSRSMSWEEAFVVTVRTVEDMNSKGIDNIFKKTDSVLRGHIAVELVAQLKAEGKKKVVLCPANPRSGRVIINGNYYIDGIPLQETGFSKDPDFPVKCNDVKKIVGTDFLCEYHFSIVNAATHENLIQAARLKNHETILAGSAAFFEAYLESLNLAALNNSASEPVLNNVLFVRGSAYDRSRNEVKKVAKDGAGVTFISALVYDNPDFQRLIDNYVMRVNSQLRTGKNAILAIGDPVLKCKEAALKVKRLIAEVTVSVLAEGNVHELIIEGGATTSAILDKLNLTRFIPTFEYAPGVVRMKISENETMYLTIKPGSYQFPEQVWNYWNNN